MAANVNWLSRLEKISDGLSGVADRLKTNTSPPVPFTSPSMNWALEKGGAPRGTIITLCGPYSSGKTFIAYDGIKNLQQQDPEAWTLWYDTEINGFNAAFVAKLGLDPSRIYVIKKNSAVDVFDHFFDTMLPMIQEGWPCRGLVIDSLKSIVGPKEAELKQITDHVRGDLSTLLPKVLRKMLVPVVEHNLLTFLTQQVIEEQDQEKIQRGVKWHIPGGQALLHHSDLLLLVERADAKSSKLFQEEYETIREMPIQVGHTVRVKVEKSRVCPPYRVAEFQIHYGAGIVNLGTEVAKLGLSLKVIDRPNQQTYEYKHVKERGLQNFINVVEASPELQRSIMTDCYAVDVYKLGLIEQKAELSFGASSEGKEF